MKKILAVICGVVLGAAMCSAQSLKIGGHVGYTVGGDIEDKSSVFGGQMAVQMSDVFSVELSGTRMSDKVGTLDFDADTFAITGRAEMPSNKGLSLYGGAGVDYTTFSEKTLDAATGYHLCVGAELPVTEIVQLFAEYRYTFLKADVSADSTMVIPANNIGEKDYNFGLVRVGISFWVY